MDKYGFQYCQKIVILSADASKVLLCKRQGEADYDGTYAFVGGKMEITDDSIVAGMQREKNEELGEGFRIKLLPGYSINVLFKKNDGTVMILPHYLSYYDSGEITLSDEYSRYDWVALDKLESFEPKVPNIPAITEQLLLLKGIVADEDFVLI